LSNVFSIQLMETKNYYSYKVKNPEHNIYVFSKIYESEAPKLDTEIDTFAEKHKEYKNRLALFSKLLKEYAGKYMSLVEFGMTNTGPNSVFVALDSTQGTTKTIYLPVCLNIIDLILHICDGCMDLYVDFLKDDETLKERQFIVEYFGEREIKQFFVDMSKPVKLLIDGNSFVRNYKILENV
jgi:hypothetical protein